MSLYVLSLSGYEDYSPSWFEADITPRQFKSTVRKAMKEALPIILRRDFYIEGYEIMKAVTKILCKNYGFKVVRPKKEITFYGGCIYRNNDNKPEIFPDEIWQPILDHNKEVNNRVYEDEDD